MARPEAARGFTTPSRPPPRHCSRLGSSSQQPSRSRSGVHLHSLVRLASSNLFAGCRVSCTNEYAWHLCMQRGFMPVSGFENGKMHKGLGKGRTQQLWLLVSCLPVPSSPSACVAEGLTPPAWRSTGPATTSHGRRLHAESASHLVSYWSLSFRPAQGNTGCARSHPHLITAARKRRGPGETGG